ncbi:DgyrCDS8730 [Dimorphilus gyrociliatus]|uniref:DgyrCDS8730 n=1 Tax=Dimorphilus gyrociliatus TaxID=2664684 RepID=A0A7I8W064_9ANNE|nr:DgyrCDS8730 [Dimorphilus gyrociliatus]
MDVTQLQAQFSDTLTKTSLSIGLILGVKMKIFDTILALDSPSTSSEIANKCSLKERYVREWLGLMSTSGIISVDGTSESDKFYASDALETALKESGRTLGILENLLALLPHLPELEKCFQLDGPRGIPHERFTEIYRLFDLNSSRKFTSTFLQEFIGHVPDVISRLSQGGDVLEIGCNSGFSTVALAKMFKKSKFYGQDICKEGILSAKLLSRDMENVNFSIQDACKRTGFDEESFDWILAMDVIHDLPYPDAAIKELYRILKKDGILSIVDINAHSRPSQNLNNPRATFLYAISLCHCTPMSFGLPDSMGLGATWGKERAKDLFEECGFRLESVQDMESDKLQSHYVFKKLL